MVPLGEMRGGEVAGRRASEFAAEKLCRRMAADAPSRYVATMAKKLRVGKI